MVTSYNQVAGRSLERLAALGDGVFSPSATSASVVLVQLNFAIAPQIPGRSRS